MKRSVQYGDVHVKDEHKPSAPPGPAGWACPKGWKIVDDDNKPGPVYVKQDKFDRPD